MRFGYMDGGIYKRAYRREGSGSRGVALKSSLNDCEKSDSL